MCSYMLDVASCYNFILSVNIIPSYIESLLTLIYIIQVLLPYVMPMVVEEPLNDRRCQSAKRIVHYQIISMYR